MSSSHFLHDTGTMITLILRDNGVTAWGNPVELMKSRSLLSLPV